MPTEFDFSGLRRAIERTQSAPKRAEQIVQRARGTLTRRIIPEARRDIQTEYNLTATRITRGLSTRRVRDGVELVGSRRGVGRIEFGARWSRKQPGATSQVRKDGPRTITQGAFIAKGAAGNRHMFKRDGRARYPINAVYGPSIAQMLRRPGRAERLGGIARGILQAELTRLSR